MFFVFVEPLPSYAHELLERLERKVLTSIDKPIPKLLFYSNSHASIFHDILRVANEPPRVWWRLQFLREWSHEQAKQISREVRERAVRMAREHRSEYPSLWAAVASIAPKIGC